MNNANNLTTRETDYLIIGAGAMGMAFADEIFTKRPQAKLTLVDRRPKAGGHWNDAYPFVGLHQPAAFYGVKFVLVERKREFSVSPSFYRVSSGATEHLRIISCLPV